MLSAGFCHISCICCRQRFRSFSNNSVTSAGWELHYKEYLVEFYLLLVLILVTIVQTYLYNCTKSFVKQYLFVAALHYNLSTDDWISSGWQGSRGQCGFPESL